MSELSLSSWKSWYRRSEFADLRFPGVYAIAISDENLSDQPFSWIQEIVYIGMTRSVGGLTSRLKQFDNSLNANPGHGGAERFRYKHRSYTDLIPRLFVAVQAVKCEINLPKAQDYRLMGDVVKMEYLCFAEYVELYNHLPEFNDMKRSKKIKPGVL